MHKSQNMSQRRITLPVTLEFYKVPANRVQVSLNPYLRDPDSAPSQFIHENVRLDPWGLRDKFLTWPPEDWERFMLMAGSFSTSGLSKQEFTEWQELMREVLLRGTNKNKWRGFRGRFDPRKVAKLLAPLPMEFKWDEKAPSARIVTMRSLNAMIATIQLDLFQGAEFRVCARHDCTEPPFRVGRREKQYCCPECAHLAAVRRSRTPKTEKRKSHKGNP